jgi:prepilin signal peptidase PulO-like enzyme (type II secretory pathway)
MAPRPIPPPRGFLAAPSLDAMLHVQWLAVAALSAHMLAASLADVAERSIPDEITVPGTLLGLALAGVGCTSIS